MVHHIVVDEGEVVQNLQGSSEWHSVFHFTASSLTSLNRQVGAETFAACGGEVPACFIELFWLPVLQYVFDERVYWFLLVPLSLRGFPGFSEPWTFSRIDRELET